MPSSHFVGYYKLYFDLNESLFSRLVQNAAAGLFTNSKSWTFLLAVDSFWNQSINVVKSHHNSCSVLSPILYLLLL